MSEPLDLEATVDLINTLYARRPHEGKWSEFAEVRVKAVEAVCALHAEVERLRAIAAPLERLEAWLHLGRDRRSRAVHVELDDGWPPAQWGSDAQTDTLPAAITAALDAWERDHGKDGA